MKNINRISSMSLSSHSSVMYCTNEVTPCLLQKKLCIYSQFRAIDVNYNQVAKSVENFFPVSDYRIEIFRTFA
ncbi:MAG: hypothetical protein LBR51_05375 [Bacteroidales bacterium]|jgi:hypothetical protein|nr:hypothetical protein [Bacteroidales bacterium]